MIRIDARKRAFLRFQWLAGPRGPLCYMPLAVWREWCARVDDVTEDAYQAREEARALPRD